MKETATQEGIRQVFFIVGRDDHQRTVDGTDRFACFVDVKLHLVEFTQQVVGELNVRFVDLVDQQHHRFVRFKGLPEHTLEDVVADVPDFLVAQLRIAQARHGVVFV